MTTSLYLQCSIMFLLGHWIDLFLIKIPEYRNMWKTANEIFSWKRYWSTEWNVIVGTMVFGALCVIGGDQLLNLKPVTWNYAKWIYAALGGFGSSVIISKWSAAKRYIMNVIDKKTNQADGISNDAPPGKDVKP